MTTFLTRSIGFAGGAAIVLAACAASAQPLTRARMIAQAVEPPPAENPPQIDQGFIRMNPVFRMGQDFTVHQNDTVADVVVLFGSPRVEGHVMGNVVVVLGSAELTSTAVVDGNVVVVAGTATVASGAAVHGDFVVVGGASDTAEGFRPGGEQVVIGMADVGPGVKAFVPWLTHGLLWGRLIVPGLSWVWLFVGVVFLVSLGLAVIFDRPVAACADALSRRPMSAFLTGLAVLLLAAPVLLILAASVIGLAVVPFVLCAMVIAWLLGKVGVVRWIGRRILPESSPDARLDALRSFLLGFAVLCVAYMIPVIGLVTWATVSVFGLGAAALTFMAKVRRENPVPAPRPRAAVPGTSGPVGSIPVPAAVSVPIASAAAAPAAESDTPMVEPMTFASAPFAPAAVPYDAAQVGDLMALPHAGFAERLAAFVLDVILVFLIVGLLDLTNRNGLVFLLLLAYHVGFWTWKGTTVGGIICQLYVIRVDGQRVRFGDALVRGLSSVFSLAVLGLGGLWILKDPERQAWHDKIAGTYVVKVPKHWRLP